MDTLRIVTLNLWGIPLNLSADREHRFRAFGDVLPRLQADLVSLQEVWTENDEKFIISRAAAAGLSYAHYFRSGAFGSGLLVLSRYPIQEVLFHQFRLKGKPEKIWQGDFYAGKGIGLARVQSPAGLLDFYNMHPIAQYASDDKDEYTAHRTAAMYEAANFINAHSPSNPVILAGDFNITPHQPAYRMLLTLGCLTDGYDTLYPDDPSITFSLENPYNRNYREPERLDYICLRNGENQLLEPQSAEIILKHQPEYPYMPYSDHYGVQLDVAFRASSSSALPQPQASAVLAVLQNFAGEIRAAHDSAQQRRGRNLLQLLASLAGMLYLNRPQDEPLSLIDKLIRSLYFLLAPPYALLQLALWLLVVPEEIQVLRALSREVRVKIISRQNGQH